MAEEQAAKDAEVGAVAPESAVARATLADMVAKETAVAGLLRQLSSGLSAYRLFPGDLRQSSFVSAVERIRLAAEHALKWGPVETEILGAHFRTESGPVITDERIERLALACYQHRAERLSIRSIPNSHDLGALYEALSTKDEDESTSVGIGSALRVAGVTSIVVSELAPQAAEAALAGTAPSAEQRALWQRLEDPEAMARDLLEDELESILEQSQSVFRKLQRLVTMLPDKQAKAFELYRRLHEIVGQLPDGVRRSLCLLLIEEAGRDPLAERFVGTMTDAELARTLVDLGVDGGPDPQALAARLVGVGARGDNLLDLTTALLAGQEESGTILAGLERVGISVGAPVAGSAVAETVSELAARGLLSMGQEDVRAIRDVFPHSEEDERTLALEALQDYLTIETDVEQLTEVLTVWAQQLAGVLRERDLDGVARLMDAVEGAASDPGDVGEEKRMTVLAFVRRVLDRPLLAELVSLTDADSAAIVRLLDRFGDVAVDSLLEDLAAEQERGRRALLLGVLSEMARSHRTPVAARLEDPRWFVVRNAVTILYRSGGGDLVPLMVQAAQHEHPAVRREAVVGLLEVAGLDNLDELLRLAEDRDESVRLSVLRGLGGMVSGEASAALARLVLHLRSAPDRRRAMEELARHSAPQAADALRELASSGSRPRLPWRFRRMARAYLKQRLEASG